MFTLYCMEWNGICTTVNAQSQKVHRGWYGFLATILRLRLNGIVLRIHIPELRDVTLPAIPNTSERDPHNPSQKGCTRLSYPEGWKAAALT